ncbi:alpha/beta hydrolase [Paenibacillus sp. IB182496]|uniref:Alpha/beta hydrolase n=1 Tax=Paenibacillus sabuli TaxID=2772509 RepID=A0A927GQR3_9BACL|nr:alpha/beta hydrolase [Paenibacillus sabuli]MBD2844037.1 alpha/beta hydrolase [Paenibacillus sabuli]
MNEVVLRRNNVNVTGAGEQTMLFAPGFGCDQNMWRFVAPAFEAEYRVVRFDYVGTGRSDKSAYTAERYQSLDGYVQDVLDICEALHIENAILVGHSVGAMVGLLASLRADCFRHLVLLGPSPRYINDGTDYIGGFEREDIEQLLELMERNHVDWADYLAPLVMGNPERPELARELGHSFCSLDPQIARQFARATFMSDNRADLARVTVPSLILQSSQDLITPLEVGAYVHDQLRGSELQFMEATGHCPHVSHPEETSRLIRTYLNAS